MTQVNENVIADLLPLYHAKRLSEDSRKLVDDYFAQNPQFADENKLTISLQTPKLEKPDEMKMLKRTRFLILTKTFMLISAIFTACLTFAFTIVYANGDSSMQWIWKDTPEDAIFAGVVSLGFGIIYIMINKYLKLIEIN